MQSNVIKLPWGAQETEISLPESWDLLGIMQPSPQVGETDPFAETQRSLQSPYGSPRLSEIAKPGMKIALVVDDGSRPTPVSKILPAVLAELQAGGADVSQISVVAALGVHRAMADEELGQRLGHAGLRFETHDCDDPEKLSDLGVTSRGTPAVFCKVAAEADLVISIGCIEPHVIASFGGGYKNLLPGVASRQAIAHNHALNCKPKTYNMVGQPIEQNPMRLDLEEAGKMIKAKVFIVNAVINSSLEVVKVVCGDPIAAHREGVKVSASLYGARVPELAEVVITASHPMDQDLRQGVKALSNNIRAVRKGGIMINLIRAEEGVGVFGLANRKLPVGKGVLKLIAPLLLPRVPKLKLKGMGEEDRFFLYFALQAMLQCKIFLYAPTIPMEIHERLPFVEFVPSVEAALTFAYKKFPNAKVLVFPHGGMTYPIL